MTGILDDNVRLLKEIFHKDMDYSLRTFELFQHRHAAIVYLNSLVDQEVINHDVIKPLQHYEAPEKEPLDILKFLIDNILYFNDVKK